ncbi:hypothetical protein [Streptomyces sp. NPDC002619]|uniref:hypothetical protein n=1 Tax=Streptomyces sp. NPDC002619 TaxID=3364655 RepID=UPI0036A82BB6
MGEVDIDERQLVRARQQGGVRGQCGQESAVDSVELKGMPVSERAKEGAQRGRGTGTCEHGRHRPVPQDVKAVNAVRTRGHACEVPKVLCMCWPGRLLASLVFVKWLYGTRG